MQTKRSVVWSCVLAATVALWSLSSAACLSEPNVVRVVDGEEAIGRFVRPDAYALFLEGVLAEQAGHLAAAERLYLAAHRRDREGVAILTRLGAVRCAWGPEGYGPAQDTFSEAIEIDAEYAPLHVERSKCSLTRGFPRQAVVDAHRALEHAPFDVDVSIALSDALEADGKGEQAARVLDALSHVRPSERVYRAILGLARRRGDEPRVHVASLALSERESSSDGLVKIDVALTLGDLDDARAHASREGLQPGELAVRAAALGLWRVARAQARVVLAAEPGHPDAMVAWLASPEPSAAHDSVDASIWRRLLRADESRRDLSVLGMLVMVDALRRRFGREVALAWFEQQRRNTHTNDALVWSLRKRLALP